MGNIIKNIIHSLRNKQNEKLLEQISYNDNFTNLSEKKYLTLLSYLKSENAYIESSWTAVFYHERIVHIKDEALSKLLYTKLIEEQPEGEENIAKYITIESQKKLVFIVCPESYFELSTLYDTVQTFCKKLSSGDQKVHIDYARLFFLYIHRIENAKVALFGSIVLGDYTLYQENLENIIGVDLFGSFGTYESSYHELYKDISSSSDIEYQWLRRGVSLDVYTKYSGFPRFMEINIYRYVMEQMHNKKIFSNYEEFFKNFLDDKLKSANIIFDEEVFLKKLTFKEENDSYVVYLDKAFKDQKGKCNSFCMKLKNPKQTSQVQNVILDRHFDDVKLLYTIAGDVYIFWTERGSEKLAHIRNNIPEVVYNIIISFSKAKYLKENIFLKAGTNLLDCVCCDNQYKMTFANLQCISFEKQATDIMFEYPVLVIQYLKNCVEQAKTESEKNAIIYSCMKFLSPYFAMQFNDYLQTGTYDLPKLQKSLENIIEVKATEDVIFLEEIDCSKPLKNAICFFNNTDLPDNAVQSIKGVRRNLQKFGIYGNYTCMDKIAIDLVLEKNRKLSKKNIQNIISNKDNPFVIKPTKVIISRDVFNKDGYIVIGVELNKGQLYNFAELVKSKVLNSKQIYTVIYNLLYIHNKHGYCIKGNATSPEIIKSIFVDDFLNVYFGNANIIGKDNRMGNAGYYIRIIEKLIEAKIIGDTVIPAPTMFRDVHELKDVQQKIQNMELCPEHNLWHIGETFCEECEKNYAVYNEESFKTQPYQNGAVSFYYTNGTTSKIFDGVSPKNVKLGLQHNLYEKFTGIVPRKLLVQSTANAHKNSVLGILYEQFDFSNVVELNDFKQLQRLKAVLVLYKQIFPSIMDGSFVCSNKRIYDTMVMHKEYKGQILIPDILLLETDVILSTDAVLKKTKKQETKKAFFDFIYKYLSQDELLKIDKVEITQILNDVKNHKINEKFIKKYLTGKDKYCKVHKLNYANNTKVCPLCIRDGIPESRTIIKDKAYFQKLESSNTSYEGGEANLYNVGDGTIQKIFNAEVDIAFKSKIIGKTIEKQPLFVKFNNEHKDIQFVYVDDVLYSFDNNFLELKGYTQKFIEGSYKISCLKDKEFVAKHNITRLDVIDILTKVCIGIQFLHSNDCFIGDLNGGNILIKGKTVYFIDFDGMSMDDVKNNVYTNMYIYPPSVEAKNITKEDDWYSLAVQAFYYLTYSHPFRGVCNNGLVPTNEMERMKQHKSLLGNHGIIPPSISEGWDNLPKPLVQYFLDTFENKKRESMLEILTSYKSMLEKLKASFKEIIRQREVFDSISEDLYIDVNHNLIYKETVILQNVFEIKRFEDSVLVKGNVTYLVMMDGTVYEFNTDYSNVDLLDVYNGHIFHRSRDRVQLFVDVKADNSNSVKTLRIPRYSNLPVIDLKVIEQNVLIYTEYNTNNGHIRICYNNNCVWESSYSFTKATLSLRYDNISESAVLIIYNQSTKTTSGVLINKSLDCTEFTISSNSEYQYEFHGNVLYWTTKGKICCYNVVSNKLKTIECAEATETSRVMRKDNTFYIGNGKQSYLFTKT